MASRTVRSYTLDYTLAEEIDRRAEAGKRSDLVNELLAEALQARSKRHAVAQGLVQAGVGTAAMTAILVLAFILLL